MTAISLTPHNGQSHCGPESGSTPGSQLHDCGPQHPPPQNGCSIGKKTTHPTGCGDGGRFPGSAPVQVPCEGVEASQSKYGSFASGHASPPPSCCAPLPAVPPLP